MGAVCLSTALPAQSPPEIKPLTIGDAVPNLAVTNMMHSPSPVFHLSDTKGKVVIMYFWEPFCSACIGSLPKIDSLQHQFRNEIQVVTVTRYGSRKQIEHLLNKNKLTRNITLPIVIRDSLFYQYFKHAIVPHVVWMDTNGVVRNVTRSEYINQNDIAAFLADNALQWPQKEDVINFNYKDPLFTLANKELSPPDFSYYSSFCGHLPGLDATGARAADSSRQCILFNFFNLDLIQLGRLSVENATAAINRKQLLLITNKPDQYIYDQSEHYDTWSAKHTYCYSLQLPSGISRARQINILENDLKRWLSNVCNVSMAIEQRLRPCLLLEKTGVYSDSLLRSKGGKFINTLGYVDDSVRVLQNANLSNLVAYLNESVPDIPWVIDSTGLPMDEKIDLELSIKSFNDIPDLKQALLPYGLTIIESRQYLKTYVFTDHGNTIASASETAGVK